MVSKTGSKNNSTNFAVDLKGECIGVVGVRYDEHETAYSGEIDYWIAEHHWGKGIASEATSKMTDYVLPRLRSCGFLHWSIALTRPQ